MYAMFNGQPIFGPRGPAGPDGNPIGTIISYMGLTAPQDYLVCDGAEYNITDYSELARFFETQFGAANHFGGDGTTTFAVPNLQDSGSNAAVLHCIKAVTSMPAENVYSTEERVVGQWIDGKPIYRKVFAITSPSSTSGSWTDIVNVSYIDSLISIYGYLLDHTGSKIPFSYSPIEIIVRVSGMLSMIVRDGYLTSCPTYIVLEYTKITN